MASDQPVTTDTPVFYEALAEWAKCSVPDAIEHFSTIPSQIVTDFLTEYVAHA